jgi:hypothetical protein
MSHIGSTATIDELAARLPASPDRPASAASRPSPRGVAHPGARPRRRPRNDRPKPSRNDSRTLIRARTPTRPPRITLASAGVADGSRSAAHPEGPATPLARARPRAKTVHNPSGYTQQRPRLRQRLLRAPPIWVVLRSPREPKDPPTARARARRRARRLCHLTCASPATSPAPGGAGPTRSRSGACPGMGILGRVGTTPTRFCWFAASGSGRAPGVGRSLCVPCGDPAAAGRALPQSARRGSSGYFHRRAASSVRSRLSKSLRHASSCERTAPPGSTGRCGRADRW